MDQTVDIKIYGCHSRDAFIEKYKETINLDSTDIIYDDRPNGGNAYYTFRKALLQPVEEGVTHRLILPDDMQLCEGFKERLNFLVSKFPKKVLELFPFGYNALDSLSEKTPYYRTFAPSACGLVFPVQIINEMIDWIDNKYTLYHNTTVEQVIDDTAVMAWCQEFSVDMITTIPALVQHLGDDSLLGDFPIRRTNFFIEDMPEDTRAKINWESDEIKEYHPHPKKRLPDGSYEFRLVEQTVTILNPQYSSLGITR